MRPRITGDLVTVLVGVSLAALIFVGSLVLAGSVGGGTSYRVKALLPTTSSLTQGSRVTMAGVPVGRVADIRRQGYGTIVELDIRDEDVVPLPADSRVTLRQRTPIGENYLELTPGTSRETLDEDGTLPIGQAEEYVDVDQILSVLRGRSRRATRELIQGLGGALEGQGARLNTTLGEASTVVRHGASVLTLLSEDRRRVASLVDRVGRVAAAVGERGAAVEVLADRGVKALQAVGSRDAALRATLRELPPTLRQVRGTSGRLRAASTVATPVLRDAARAVRELAPAVRTLRPAAQQGRNAVRELGRAAAPLEKLLGVAAQESGPLASALPSLRSTICQLNPVARYVRPYAKDVVATAIGLGSVSNSYDAIGHLVRMTPIVNENSLVGLPDEVSKAAHTLLRAGMLGKMSPLTWDPYPKPGMVGRSKASDKPGILGPKQHPKTGYDFPRLKADC